MLCRPATQQHAVHLERMPARVRHSSRGTVLAGDCAACCRGRAWGSSTTSTSSPCLQTTAYRQCFVSLASWSTARHLQRQCVPSCSGSHSLKSTQTLWQHACRGWCEPVCKLSLVCKESANAQASAQMRNPHSSSSAVRLHQADGLLPPSTICRFQVGVMLACNSFTDEV